MVEQKYEIEIENNYAATNYYFHFVNSTYVQEISYNVKIDPNCFISNFKAIINDNEYVGDVKAREVVKKEYAASVQKKTKCYSCFIE